MSESKINLDDFVCEKWWFPLNLTSRSSFKIWRYMDMAKYIALLHSSSLWLAQADRFADPFEGLYNEPTNQALRHITPHDPLPIEDVRAFSNELQKDKEATYINCWHWNESESAAMWKLYSNNDHCVAIVSDVFKLMRQLPPYVAFSFVRYIDWDKNIFTAPGMSQSPFFHKRREFAHEQEVRVIYMQPLHHQRGGPRIASEDAGMSLKVDLPDLIDEIVLAPTTPSWVPEMIRETTRRYDQSFDVRVSSLLSNPR